ncbi:MAG TPA: EAL domain-containing protein [Acidimicrobiales bacterium]|nr:EAL domain-containing protein [Acidimicrobiales bacterium]
MNFPSWRNGVSQVSSTLARASQSRVELPRLNRATPPAGAGTNRLAAPSSPVSARQRPRCTASAAAVEEATIDGDTVDGATVDGDTVDGDTGDEGLGLGGSHLVAGPKTYTVLIADDATATRRALVELLEDIPDLVCVAAVGDANAAVIAAASFRPDVALLDVMMPGGGGLSAALGIRDVSPQTRMLAYSVSADRTSVIQMLRSGARGYLVKGSPAKDLIDGLRRCGDGFTALSEGLSEHLVAEMGELGRAEQEDSAAARARYERFLKLLQPGGSTPTYQPVVNLRTGGLAGYEALTRFGDQMGSTTEEIFREAHQVGLGVDLELHTARLAVNAFGPEMARSEDTYLAVNASPGLLYRPALLEVLSQLPAERVIVEITEQRQFESYVQLRETVQLVHERGMRVAVDDTGSGFASLQRLVDVRPEIVKLDRGLTSQIDSDAPRRALVTAIRHFADDMGITVVAEGIEREEQLIVLRDIGVDCGQGYLLGRPAPLPVGS